MRPNGDYSKEKNNYISLQEAAQIYGCTQKHMNLMARQGRLKAVKIGRNWFTTREWLEKYKKKFNSVSDNSERYISLSEAAKVYECTQRHLSLIARQGKLKAVRVGRNWFTTFKWLEEYVGIAKKEKAVPFKITSLPSFKKFAVGILVGLLIFCFISTVFVGIREKTFPGSNSTIISGEEIIDAYSSVLKLTKDSFESLVFNSANFAKDSYIKVVNNNVKDLNNSPAQAIIETNKILGFIIDSLFGKEIDKISQDMASIFTPVEEATFDWAEKFTATHHAINKKIDKLVWEPLSPITKPMARGFKESMRLLGQFPKRVGQFFGRVFDGFIAFLDAIFGKSGHFVINKVSKAISFIDKFFSSTRNIFVQLPRGLKSLITFDFLIPPYPTGVSDQTFVSLRDLYRRLAEMREYMEGKKIIITQSTQEIIKEIIITRPVEIRKEVSVVKEQAELDALKSSILAIVDSKLGNLKTSIYEAEHIENIYYYSEATEVARIDSFNNDITFNENVDVNKNLTVDETLGANMLTANSLIVSGSVQFAGGTVLSYSRFGTATTNYILSDAYDLLISGDLEVDGQTWFDNDVSISNNLDVGGDVTIGGNLNAGAISYNTASVADDFQVGANTLYVNVGSGSYDFGGTGTASFAGPVNILGDLDVDSGTLWIDSSGNAVGIGGDYSPSYTLSVDGTASVSDDFYVGGDSLFFDLSADKFLSSSSWQTVGDWSMDGTASISGTLTATTLGDGTAQLTGGALSSLVSLGSTHASISDDFETLNAYITSASFGTIRGGVWNGTDIDISDYTTLTAGDFITLTDDDLDIDTAAVTNGDTTHLSSADAIYDFVTGLSYLTSSVSTDFSVGDSLFYVNVGTQSYQFGGTGTASFVGPVNISQDLDVSEGDLFVDDSSGYVGIGTTAPGATLEIRGGSYEQELLRLTRSGSNYISFLAPSGDGSPLTIQAAGTNAMKIYTFSELGFAVGDVRFNQQAFFDGNVGIGNTVPGYKLDVAGDILASTSYFTGNIYASSSVYFDSTASISDDFYVGNNLLTVDVSAASVSSTGKWKLTTTETTGEGFYIDASTITTGNGLLIEVDATAMYGGRALDITKDESSIFSVDEWGTIRANQMYATGGSATDASYTFSGDENTGMYRGGTNELGFATDGSARMYINSSGYIGIGNISPDRLLTVAGDILASTSYFTGNIYASSSVYFDSTASISDDFYVGNNLIFADVSAASVSFTGDLKLTTTNTDGNGMYIDASTVTTGNGLRIEIDQATIDENGYAFNITRDGASILSVSKWGQVSIGQGLTAGDGTVSYPAFRFAADQDNGMYRATTDQIGFVTGGTERIRIDSSGLVGIGTTTPSTELSIVGTASLSQDLWASGSFQFGGGETEATLSYSRLGGNDTGHGLDNAYDLLISGMLEVDGMTYFDGGTTFGSTASITGDFSVGDSLFYVNVGTQSYQFGGTGTASFVGPVNISQDLDVSEGDLFVDDSSGYIGIGDTNPSYTLSVDGTASISGQCVTGDTLLPILADNFQFSILNFQPASPTGGSNSNDLIFKQIKDVKAGNYVLSLNEETNKIEPHKINGLLDMGVQPIYELETEDGKKIRTTGNHPYLVRTNQKAIAENYDFLMAMEVGEFASPEPWLISRALHYVTPIAFLLYQNQIDSSISDNQKTTSNEMALGDSNVVFSPAYQPTFSIAEKNSLSSPVVDFGPISDYFAALQQSKIHYGASPNGDNLEKTEWTKVIYLEEGDEIAVATDDLEEIKFVKIAKITQLPAEQVYDIEVENTHNFIANGIVAHNTYIQGNTLFQPNTDSATFFQIASSSRDGSDAVFTVDTSNEKVILRSGSSGTHPVLSFGDGDTGIFESIDDTISLTLNNEARGIYFTTNGLQMSTSAGWAMLPWQTPGSTIPGFSFYQDENTGLGRADDDTLSLIGGGISLMQVGEYNNLPFVGIGTAATTSYTFAVDGTASISDDFYVDNTTLFVDASENKIGIATTSFGTEMMRIAQNADDKGLKIFGYDDVDTSYGHLYADNNGYFNLYASDRMILNPVTTGRIQSNGQEVAYWGGDYFIMNDDKGLVFGGSYTTDATFEWDTNQTNDSLLLGLGDSNTLIVGERSAMGVNYALASQSQPSIFLVNQNGTVDSVMNATGFGIGDTSPGYKLSVDGTASISGSLYVGDSQYNTFVGIGTDNAILYTDTSGTPQYNSLFGYQAGYNMATQSYNTFVGYEAGYNASSSYNALFGYQAGYSLDTGASNSFFGSGAGYANTTGYDNVFIGAGAGDENTTGLRNVFIGSGAGRTNLNRYYNVMIGDSTGEGNNDGWGNTFLGFGTGTNNNGSLNVFIGRQAGMDESGDNKLYIANDNLPIPLIYGDFSTDTVCINCDSTSYTLGVDGTASISDDFYVGGDSLFFDLSADYFYSSSSWSTMGNWDLDGTASISGTLNLEDEFTIGSTSYTNIIKTSDAEGLAGNDLRVGLDSNNMRFIITDKAYIDQDIGWTGTETGSDPALIVMKPDDNRWASLKYYQLVLYEGTDGSAQLFFTTGSGAGAELLAGQSNYPLYIAAKESSTGAADGYVILGRSSTDVSSYRSRVGILDATPDFGLEISASVSANGWFAITSDEAGNNNGDIFVVDENKNIGIGDTNPSYNLSVDGTASISDTLYVLEDTLTASNSFVGINTKDPGALLGIQDDNSSDWLFAVSSTSAANYFNVASTGYISIGTTDPAFDAELAIDSSNSPDSNYADLVLDGAIGGQVIFTDDGNSEWSIYSDDDLNFYTGGGGGYALVLQMTTGNVGIGDSAPGYKLSVDGTASISDDLYLDDTLQFKAGSQYEIMGVNDSSLDISAEHSVEFWIDSDGDSTSWFDFYSGSGRTNVAWVTETGQIYSADLQAAGTDQMCWDGSGTSYIGDCTSLREFKENIEDLDLGLETVLQLQPRTFFWKQPEVVSSSDPHAQESQKNPYQDLGFIAEEVEEINPLLTTHRDGKLVGVRYEKLTAILTNAVQEMTNVIDLMEAPRDSASLTIDSLGNIGIGGTASISGDLNVAGQLCLGETCISEDQLKELTANLNKEGGIDEKVSVEYSTDPIGFLGTLVSGLKDLGVDIADGVIKATQLVVNEVKTKILRISVAKDKDNVVGSATIPAQQIEFRVNNSLVEENSKIFITFTSDTGGRTWHISEKVPGVGFTIRLSDVTPEPLDFDYLIVLVEEKSEARNPKSETNSNDQNPNDPICGDGEIYIGEECDDGNLIDGDGCDATCMTEVVSEEPPVEEPSVEEPPAEEEPPIEEPTPIPEPLVPSEVEGEPTPTE